MTNHAFADDLSAYLEGDLPEAKRAAIERELERSPELQAELEAMQLLRQTLREMPDPEVPFGLSTRVMARIEDGEANPQTGLSNFLRPIQGWLSPLATAACGFAAAAFLFGTDLGESVLSGGEAPQEIVAADSTRYRNPRQVAIPGVDHVGSGNSAGRTDRSLTEAPKSTRPTAVASESRSNPSRRVTATPSAPAAVPAPRPTTSAVPGTPNPRVLAALDAAESDASAAPVAYGDSLEFRACLTASPSVESGCEDTFKNWYELARDDAPAFQIQMTRVPVATRSLWVRQLNSYAARSGENYRIPVQQNAPVPDDSGRDLDHMRAFGPNTR